MSYILRQRQIEAVDKIDKFIKQSKKNHGIFVFPTSFGKSLIVANIASKYPDKYFINLTTSKELLKQNYEKYTSYGFEADICSASLNSKNVGKVTFATISTLTKFVDYFKDKEVVILFDEAHLASARGSQLDLFLKKLNSYKLVGITATPFRLSSTMDGTTLKLMNRDRDCIYKSIEDIVQIEEVVNQGYWSKLIYDIRNVDESSLSLNTSGTEYTDSSLKEFKEKNDLNNKIVDEVKKLISNGRKSILISVPFISDTQEISKKLESCEAVYSGMNSKDRDRIVSDFKNLKLKVVVQCSILSVGFDHPQLDAIVLGRPSNSLTFIYQLLGRGVRIHPEKENCLIVDFSGNCRKFGEIEKITIENNELTKGWAVFNGDILLSNYPLNTLNRPTKQSLQAKIDREKHALEGDATFYFGKYNNKKVSDVIKENKSYLTWILEQKDFNWYGEKGKLLKESIEKQLGVFIN